MQTNGSHQSPEGSNDAVGWTPDLLMSLDWRRFHDLMRVVVTKAGYRVNPILLGEAGVGLFGLSFPGRKDPEALLCCSPWDQAVVGHSLVSGFHQEMVNRGFSSGTMFTPGHFRDAAREFEGERPVELVDGSDFVEVLGRLPRDEREFLLQLTTAGEYDVPTCPACGVKLEYRDSEMPKGVGRLKNLTVRSDKTFAGDVRCNKLTIAKGGEAQFSKGVYANKLVVNGRAVGNFTCSGSAEIGAGAFVIGMVAARSVKLHPGGVLDGEMKILDEAEVKPVREHPKELIWGCPNYPKCKVYLHPRGEAPAAEGKRSAA